MATFRLVEKIGQGSYSKVYKAVNDVSMKTLAVKVISLEVVPRKYIQSREIKILRQCRHPNIAPLLDYFVSEDSMYLVFEYFQMNLSQYSRYYRNIYKKNLGWEAIRHIMFQICSGIQYLHSKGIMHRDIKPQNIMINPLTQQVKLVDFGFAKHKGQTQDTGYMVTRWYRALEVVLGLPYDEKIDVFAAGAILLELIIGKQVFQSSSNNDQLHMLLNVGGYPESGTKQHEALLKMNIADIYRNQKLQSLTRNIDDSTRYILASMLNNSSQKRISIDKVLQHLANVPTVASGTREQRGSSFMGSNRRRSTSAANGLTLVSLALGSRSRSNSKAQKELLARQGKRHEGAWAQNGLWNRLGGIAE